MRRPVHQSFPCAGFWLTKRVGVAQRGRTAAGLLFALLCLLMQTACGASLQQRVLYEASGMQVGLITDLSTNDQASPPVTNRHPADFTPQDIRSLLGSLEVSGWSGTMMGLFSTPPLRPVFTEAELAALAEPVAAAFHEATPRERVFFAINNPSAPYETDRTAGSLFFRDEYLHVLLMDHYAYLKADTAGGETRDPRDTKGMKLWAVGPARAAIVPEGKQPHWNSFEKVHLSLTPVEILAGQRVPPATPGSSRPQAALPVTGQPALNAGTSATNATESVNDLRVQIRELTNANLDLRARFKEQSDTIEALQIEQERLRNEIKAGKSKPSSERKPSRKQPAP